MTVYLVGAGPGDPELITVKGARLLAQAEVVVYDRLVHPDVVALAPTTAERISVAKIPRRPTISQEEINDVLIERGRAGLEVVRLKGGDPFIFARGGEEAQALQDAGVPYQIVPGISSAIAAPAYAGVPVTYRQEALSVTIVTGHEDRTSDKRVDWRALAAIEGTLVIMMGASHAAAIAAELIAGGRAENTPVVTIRWATYEHQEVARMDLAALLTTPVVSPSVIIVGEVAARRLDWLRVRTVP